MTILRNKTNERGQTMVEFTAVLPILAVLLFAIVEFGLTFKNYLTLADATREGARVAAVRNWAHQDPCARVTDSADGLTPTVTVTGGCGGGVTLPRGSAVTVQAQHPYSIALLGLPVWSGTLTTQATERVE
jgi:Flp pilus assembly protein TadG